MEAKKLNIDIKICPCCKSKFDNNEIGENNEVYGDLLCGPCMYELNSNNGYNH